MRIIFIIISSIISVIVYSQDANILSFAEYIQIVKENHPIMYQAEILGESAVSTKKIARGGFDPKVEGNWNHKSYDDKNYYSLLSGAVKVPTWYGIDVKAGYDRNSGQFLDESDFIPSRGLWNAGISVPLGKGLIIDQRRAELKKADIYQSMTEQQQVLMLNELLYDASIAYLKWQTAQAQLNIAQEGQQLAEIRLDGTRQSFLNGDKPAIDTLESFISLQSRQLDYQKALQSTENARLAINNYLWIEGTTPLEVDSNTIPSAIVNDLLSAETDATNIIQTEWIASHPELLLYDYKSAVVEIDQRLAKEEIKPDLRINYNPLLAVADDSLFDQFNPNNYKLGATFAYPILQRKQRGKIELNNLKQQNISYDRTLKLQELQVKLDTYINNINQTESQLDLLSVTTDNYEKMLVAENRKFEIGESSIFLVNSRERKYLETRYKMISASQKLIFNRLTYLLFAARLSEVM